MPANSLGGISQGGRVTVRPPQPPAPLPEPATLPAKAANVLSKIVAPTQVTARSSTGIEVPERLLVRWNFAMAAMHGSLIIITLSLANWNLDAPIYRTRSKSSTETAPTATGRSRTTPARRRGRPCVAGYPVSQKGFHQPHVSDRGVLLSVVPVSHRKRDPGESFIFRSFSIAELPHAGSSTAFPPR